MLRKGVSLESTARPTRSRPAACQKADCAHNNALECTAASISVGAGTADCLSYEAR